FSRWFGLPCRQEYGNRFGGTQLFTESLSKPFLVYESAASRCCQNSTSDLLAGLVGNGPSLSQLAAANRTSESWIRSSDLESRERARRMIRLVLAPKAFLYVRLNKNSTRPKTSSLL